MEVHHHTHHPKKWKEYISEFLMLFLAVFAGFLAESYLDYRTERHKEHDYLASLVTDLKMDSTDMTYKMKNMEALLDTSNSLVKMLSKNNFSSDGIYRLYNNSVYLESKDCFLQFANGTIDQLRNAGGFRLIRNKEINDKIKDYIVDQGRLNTQTELYRTEWNNSKHQRLNLFYCDLIHSDGKPFEEMKWLVDENALEKRKNETGSYFLSKDKNDFYKYSNSIASQQGYLMVYRIMASLQKEKANKLIKLIQEEIKH
jgi:hypothetical protein